MGCKINFFTKQSIGTKFRFLLTILIHHPTQPLTDFIRILHTMHKSAQLDITPQVHHIQVSPPTITTFNLLTRIMNTPLLMTP